MSIDKNDQIYIQTNFNCWAQKANLKQKNKTLPLPPGGELLATSNIFSQESMHKEEMQITKEGRERHIQAN